jgi:hypothetical protein
VGKDEQRYVAQECDATEVQYMFLCWSPKNTNFIYLTKLKPREYMFAEILELEKKFNALLPVSRQLKPSSAALLEASSNWSAAIWHEAKQLGRLSFTPQQIDNALRFTERAIFICGSERSGTTLVRNLLDAHPLLSVLPSEGTYLTNLENKMLALPANKQAEFMCREWLWRLVTSMHVPPYWLLGRSRLEHSPYIDFTRAFISWWDIVKERLGNKNSQWPFLVLQLAFATSQNKMNSHLLQTYWVEKTPRNEQFLKSIWNDFPYAKVIHVVRNPVDVLKSLKPYEQVSSIDTLALIQNLKVSFSIASNQLAKNNKQHLVVRYEDVCEEPLSATKKIADFLGIDYLPCLMEPTVVGQLVDSNSSFKQDDATGKIMKTKDHKQEDKLTKKDLELLSASLRKLVEPFGYNLQPIGILRKQVLIAASFTKRTSNKIKRTIFGSR